MWKEIGGVSLGIEAGVPPLDFNSAPAPSWEESGWVALNQEGVRLRSILHPESSWPQQWLPPNNIPSHLAGSTPWLWELRFSTRGSYQGKASTRDSGRKGLKCSPAFLCGQQSSPELHSGPALSHLTLQGGPETFAPSSRPLVPSHSGHGGDAGETNSVIPQLQHP